MGGGTGQVLADGLAHVRSRSLRTPRAWVPAGSRRSSAVQKPIPIDFCSRSVADSRSRWTSFCRRVRAAAVLLCPARGRHRAGARRASDGCPTARRSGRADVFRPLARGFPNRSMHPYYVTLAGERRRYFPIREHLGQEFIYVLNRGRSADGCRRRALYLRRSSPATPVSLTQPSRTDSPARMSTLRAALGRSDHVFWSPLGEAYLFDPDGPTTAA